MPPFHLAPPAHRLPLKEWNWVICRDLKEPRVATQSEASQKEEKTLYSKTYMWNLEKWHGWTCLQGRNREADPRTDMRTQGGGARWDESGDWDWLVPIVTCKTELVGTCCAVQGVQLCPGIQYFFMCREYQGKTRFKHPRCVKQTHPGLLHAWQADSLLLELPGKPTNQIQTSTQSEADQTSGYRFLWRAKN